LLFGDCRVIRLQTQSRKEGCGHDDILPALPPARPDLGPANAFAGLTRDFPTPFFGLSIVAARLSELFAGASLSVHRRSSLRHPARPRAPDAVTSGQTRESSWP